MNVTTPRNSAERRAVSVLTKLGVRHRGFFRQVPSVLLVLFDDSHGSTLGLSVVEVKPQTVLEHIRRSDAKWKKSKTRLS